MPSKKKISYEKYLKSFLNTLHDQLEKISACVPGNFYWKNTKAQYLGCNDTLLKTLGLKSMADIIGKTDLDLWPEQADELKENDQRVIQTGETLFLEEKVTMSNQEYHYFTVIKMPLLDEKGNIIGILGNSLDITELKNTQEKLNIAIKKAEAANFAKTEFITNMSHDIRTPLTGIIGLSQYLESHIKDLQEKECAKQIHESGEQLLKLLNGVLDMITADSTNEENRLGELFDLHELIQDVLILEQPAVYAKHLTIKSYIDKLVPHYVIGDKMKLHRILLNLTGNAIKFTKTGYIELHVKLLAQEKNLVTIEFQVKDTGIGIPKALQDKVFDRFFKVSPSHKGLYSGNGIGLHIAQKYVERLGGKLRLESQEGVGTSFLFTLNMTLGDKEFIKQKQEIMTPTLPVIIKKLHPNQLRVLLIEDNIAALKVLEMMMKPYSADIYTTKDAEAAFLLVQQQPFDLIISDIGLPQKNGDQLASDIRAWEDKHHRSSCIIVGLTGHSDGDITRGCLKSGMNAIYQKPITAEQLKNLVERFKADTESTLSHSNTSLGFDLPMTEEELFHLDLFPLLDIDAGLNTVGTIDTLKELLVLMLNTELPQELDAIQQAHAVQNWPLIEAIAHKIKSGALYCGITRMKYACQYLERYPKAGHSHLQEQLYQQLIKVTMQTQAAISTWLDS